MGDIDLSVVVVTYNSADCAGQCLTSVATHLPTVELIVVDNGSADDSVAVCRRAFPDAAFVELGANCGFGRACNAGAERATRSHVLFLNPDVTVTSADVRALGRDLDVSPFGLLVPLLAPGGGLQPMPHLRPYRHWARQGLAQLWSPLLPRELAGPPRLTSDLGRSWASAAMLLVDREEFHRLGGFDPSFFLYSEDLELSRRYRERRLPLRTTSALVGAHTGTGSSTPGEDELRIVPAGWALLGWLQYLHRWHGDSVARRAAALMLATLDGQARGLAVLGHVPGIAARARRKRRQIAAVRNFVLDRSLAADADDGFCAAARAAVRAVACRGSSTHRGIHAV